MITNRPSFFADAGISGAPTTYDEFWDVAKKLTNPAKNQYGFYLLGATTWSYQQATMWMFSHGGMGAAMWNTIFRLETS